MHGYSMLSATNRELFAQLATAGQHPETLFITCSDSRVVPNLITNAAPGELFIVRNVGNLVPRAASALACGGVTAAIEFAAEVLQVQNVIVCGHTACGAMEAILNPAGVAHLEHVRDWLDQTHGLRELVASRYAHLAPADRVTAAVEENVLAQIENLRTFPFVARRLDAGTLHVNGWVFNIATGEVFDYDPATEQFGLLTVA